MGNRTYGHYCGKCKRFWGHSHCLASDISHLSEEERIKTLTCTNCGGVWDKPTEFYKEDEFDRVVKEIREAAGIIDHVN